MKKLKRRVSAALRFGSTGSTGAGGGSMNGHHHHTTLADSMSELAERIAAVGELVEECGGDQHHLQFRHHQFCYPSEFIPDRPDPLAHFNNKSPTHQYIRNRGRTSSWQTSRLHPTCTLPATAFFGGSAAVVHESSNGLGSDGESMDASPCTSEQNGNGSTERYVVNVKMRQKPNRRWSEQDIQKRLSLPADLRLPLSVVEKLNRTPTLDQPLTRKSRRASLSEIGFGKLETYEKLEKLGEGTYATVYRGRSLLTEKFVALKEIRLEQEEGAPCTAIREVSLLRDLRHANVVTLHDIIHTDRLLTLVFEYVDRDLKQYMDDCSNCIAIHNVQLFLLQLVRGLAYCHQRRVLHRDLKPQNLLINEKGELKLADFGLARAKSVPTKTYSHEVVTLWYRPPDVLLGCTDYTTSIDMWGVGCILFEMVAGRALFPGSTVDEQIHLIFRTLGTPRPDRHPNICSSAQFRQYAFPQYVVEPLINQAPRMDVNGLDMLAHLLQFEGRNRMSAREALRHPYLRSVLPPAVFELGDQDSVMSVPGVHLIRDAAVTTQSSRSRRNRDRRSYLL